MLFIFWVFIDFFNMMKCIMQSIDKKQPIIVFRSSHQEVLLGKDVLKTCNKFTGEHPCRSAISIKLLLNFIEITLRHRCSPVNLLHIFRTPFLKNTSEWLLQSLFRTLLPHPDLCSMMRSKNEFKKLSPGVVL